MRTLPLLLGAALLLTFGCHTSTYVPISSPEPTTRYAVTVDSRYTRDVTVYAMRGSIQTRLGVVTAGTRRTFMLSQYLLDETGTLHLVGRAAETRELLDTDPMQIRPGQRVVWTLESRLSRSSVGVW
jgi:hypothetical protein